MSGGMGYGYGGTSTLGGSPPGTYGAQPQLPWQRTNTPQIPGATADNPTARPDFRGSGFFNHMAFGQTPFAQPNPYGGAFGMPNFGGHFMPFGATTTGGAFARGSQHGSLYRPGSMWGYGGNPFTGGGFGGGYGGYQYNPRMYGAFGRRGLSGLRG